MEGGTREDQTMGQIRKSETEIEGPQDGRRKVGMGGDFPLLYRLALNNRHYGEGTQTSAHTQTHTHTKTDSITDFKCLLVCFSFSCVVSVFQVLSGSASLLKWFGATTPSLLFSLELKKTKRIQLRSFNKAEVQQWT